MRDFGGAKAEEEEEEVEREEEAISSEKDGESSNATMNAEVQKDKAVDKSLAKSAAGTGKLEGRLIQQEKRTTGSISRAVYKMYFKAGRAWLTIPMILGSALIMQGRSLLTRSVATTLNARFRCTSYGWSMASLLGERQI